MNDYTHMSHKRKVQVIGRTPCPPKVKHARRSLRRCGEADLVRTEAEPILEDAVRARVFLPCPALYPLPQDVQLHVAALVLYLVLGIVVTKRQGCEIDFRAKIKDIVDVPVKQGYKMKTSLR